MVLCHRLLGIGPNLSTKDAELIAFRVGEYHPRRVTLPDIGPPSTEGKETFDFCGLIDRTEVRMESVLACLLLRNRHEQQARQPIWSRPDLELVRGVAHDNPAQGLGPPSTKRDRIVSVDDDLLPNEIHVAHSARSVSQADPPCRVSRIAFAAAAAAIGGAYLRPKPMVVPDAEAVDEVAVPVHRAKRNLLSASSLSGAAPATEREPAEQSLGRALVGRRDDVVIATKSGERRFDPAAGLASTSFPTTRPTLAP